MNYEAVQVGNFPRIGNKAPVITFQKNGLIRFSKWAALALDVVQEDHFEILIKGESLAIRKCDKSVKHSLRIQKVNKTSETTTTCYKVSNRQVIQHLAEVCDWPFQPGRLTQVQYTLRQIEDSLIFELV